MVASCQVYSSLVLKMWYFTSHDNILVKLNLNKWFFIDEAALWWMDDTRCGIKVSPNLNKHVTKRYSKFFQVDWAPWYVLVPKKHDSVTRFKEVFLLSLRVIPLNQNPPQQVKLYFTERQPVVRFLLLMTKDTTKINFT